MKAFAELLDRLLYTPSRNGKLTLMCNYFRKTPDPDRGYALAALTDGLPHAFPIRRIIVELAQNRFDPELYGLARDYVGDTAETLSLMWPKPADLEHPPRLAEIVERLKYIGRHQQAAELATWLDRLDTTGRWALLKFLSGAPRVGVSARLARLAVAQTFSRDVAEIEELWHGIKPPYLALFAWLEGRAARPEEAATPVFRPLMLSHPLEDADWDALDVADFAVEWKWDGIRVQLSSRGGVTRLFSRTGDDVSGAFPDVIEGAPFDAVLDGELLVVRDGEVAPFGDLQQRLNRKAVARAMIEKYPAHVRLYDALELDGEDLRALPLVERRQQLERWHREKGPRRTDVSEQLSPASKDDLRALWQGARHGGIEGLMLKRRASPYLAGRPKGHWYKWKRAALTADCVLMYAQRGAGKRSSFYSDYTFGVWTDGESGLSLVPCGKAYSGFTDEELRELDRFVRQNTTERFGPVRAVDHKLVLEVAFDAIQKSGRHKAGLAMRFPRIARIRWDKPAAEADTLAHLMSIAE